MKKLRSKIYLVILFLFTHFVSYTQEIRPISLKSAIHYALEHQFEAKKAQLELENTAAVLQESRSGLYPQISGSAGLLHMPLKMEMMIPTDNLPGGENNPESAIPLEFGLKWGASVGGTLMQSIFNQAVFTGMKAARTTREFYQINTSLTEEQIIEQVATAYYNVFIQKEKLKTLDSSYAHLEKSKLIIENLFEHGLAKEIDLDRVKVQLTNINSARQQLTNAVQLQENALKFYIGMPIHTPIEMSPVDFKVEPHFPEESLSMEQRTEMQAMYKREELLALQKKSKQAAFYPNLSLFALYSYSGQGSQFPIGKGSDKGIFWSDFALVGLNLQIPIFSGFYNKAQVDKAEVELKILREEITHTESALDLEYSNAKVQIENNWTSINNQQENVELAEKIVRNTENNYQLGLSSLTDLLEAQNALVEAKNNYSEAVLQYKLAEVQLLKAQGNLEQLK